MKQDTLTSDANLQGDVSVCAGLRMPWGLVAFVGIVAAGWQAFAFAASRLWVMPDSGGYITLAIGIAERFDFSHELFQFRPPGYPVMLASLFALFGSGSDLALMIVQHAMVGSCAVLASMIAWMAWPSRAVALLTGLLCAGSVHLTGYANGVLTEVPYTFAILLSVFLLARYARGGACAWLAGASLVVGMAVLIKPTAELMLLACVAVAVWRWNRGRESILSGGLAASTRASRPLSSGGARRASRPLSILMALAPALVLMTAVMANNLQAHGRFGINLVGGCYGYHRLVLVEGLELPDGEASRAILTALDKAKQHGTIESTATPRDMWAVFRACTIEEEMSMAEAADLMGQVSDELWQKHAWMILRRTPVHVARTLLMPDDAYRYLPGGASGLDDRLASGADLFANDTYAGMVTRQVGEDAMARYLPMSSESTGLTSIAHRFARWYRQRIERGQPITGLMDTPYEELTLLALVGGVVGFAVCRRGLWLMLTFVVGYHVVASAALQGSVPRYAVVMHPLMNIFTAVALVAACRAILHVPRVVTSLASHRQLTRTARRTDASARPLRA